MMAAMASRIARLGGIRLDTSVLLRVDLDSVRD
jgi:hypothetical protein